jgi:formylglycine-generating enzyme required for sulfatase activity
MLSHSARAAAVSAALLLSPDAGAAERVPIDGFAIDATEVTIAEFRAFARATDTRTSAEREGGGFEWSGGWQRRAGWTVYAPYGRAPGSDQEPAVHVSWHEASAFCRWRGGRLPTMAEWRLAAYTETRGAPTDGFASGRVYTYPVGDTPDGMNTRESGGQPRHAPARSTRRGVNGLYEMGGNVWEWIADRRGGEALTAGGSWWYGTQQTRADGAQWKDADFYAVYVGFRCVYPRS